MSKRMEQTWFEYRTERIGQAVVEELRTAMQAYPAMNSPHEGCAVIREEFEELWDEVKEKQSDHDLDAMRIEAVQVAAMAMRFVHDICDGGKSRAAVEDA